MGQPAEGKSLAVAPVGHVLIEHPIPLPTRQRHRADGLRVGYAGVIAIVKADASAIRRNSRRIAHPVDQRFGGTVVLHPQRAVDEHDCWGSVDRAIRAVEGQGTGADRCHPAEGAGSGKVECARAGLRQAGVAGDGSLIGVVIGLSDREKLAAVVDDRVARTTQGADGGRRAGREVHDGPRVVHLQGTRGGAEGSRLGRRQRAAMHRRATLVGVGADERERTRTALGEGGAIGNGVEHAEITRTVKVDVSPTRVQNAIEAQGAGGAGDRPRVVGKNNRVANRAGASASQGRAPAVEGKRSPAERALADANRGQSRRAGEREESPTGFDQLIRGVGQNGPKGNQEAIGIEADDLAVDRAEAVRIIVGISRAEPEDAAAEADGARGAECRAVIQ